MKLTRRVLHNPAKSISFDYPVQNLNLANEMLELMRKENGIGLSATQVGLSKRVFVMEIAGKVYHCFNPEITQTDNLAVDFDEGCLSFPGDRCIIKRSDAIKVKYQDYQGIVRQEKLSGLVSRCFQHELDHLDGITMWDRYREQNEQSS